MEKCSTLIIFFIVIAKKPVKFKQTSRILNFLVNADKQCLPAEKCLTFDDPENLPIKFFKNLILQKTIIIVYIINQYLLYESVLRILY